MARFGFGWQGCVGEAAGLSGGSGVERLLIAAGTVCMQDGSAAGQHCRLLLAQLHPLCPAAALQPVGFAAGMQWCGCNQLCECMIEW